MEYKTKKRVVSFPIKYVHYILRMHVMVTEYDYASFHSLYKNNIQDAGCAALSAALQECKELQKLE